MGSTARKGSYFYADDVLPEYERPHNWTARSSVTQRQENYSRKQQHTTKDGIIHLDQEPGRQQHPVRKQQDPYAEYVTEAPRQTRKRRPQYPEPQTTSPVVPVQAIYPEKQRHVRKAPRHAQTTQNVHTLAPNTYAYPHKQRKSKGWVILLLLGSIIGFLLLELGFFLVGWCTDFMNTLHYGPTRTTMITGVFGHNDSAEHPTAIIAMNLNGTLLLEEVPGGDTSKTKAYPLTLTLAGSDPGKIPIDLSITPGGNPQAPDVLVQVGQGSVFKLVNNGSAFTLSQQGAGG